MQARPEQAALHTRKLKIQVVYRKTKQEKKTTSGKSTIGKY